MAINLQLLTSLVQTIHLWFDVWASFYVFFLFAVVAFLYFIVSFVAHSNVKHMMYSINVCFSFLCEEED